MFNFPCLLGRRCRALKNACLPNYEILQGFQSQEQYIAQQGLLYEVPWSAQQNSHWLKQSQDFLSIPQRSAEFSVLRAVSCVHCREYHQPSSLHSLFLWWFLHVVVSALYALEIKKLPQHSGFVLFISCNNKAWLFSVFQPKLLQEWKVEKLHH